MAGLVALGLGGAAIGGLANYFGQKEQSKANKAALGAQQSFIENNQRQAYDESTYLNQLARNALAANAPNISNLNLTQQQILDSLGVGQIRSQNTLLGGIGQARRDLTSGYGEAAEQLGGLTGLQQYGLGAAQDIGTRDVVGQYGGSALMDLARQDPYANFETSPGYRFRQQQGERAINQAAAASGGRGGGNTLKALAQYNQDLASQEYDKFANQQLARAGLQGQLTGQAEQMRLGALENQAARELQTGLAAQGYQAGLGNIGFGAQSNLADLYRQRGTALGGLSQEGYGALAGMQNQSAGQLATLGSQFANTLYGAQAGQQTGLANMLTGQAALNAGIFTGVAQPNYFAGAQGAGAGYTALGGAAQNALGNLAFLYASGALNNKPAEVNVTGPGWNY